MGRVELPCLLAHIGRKIADQILVDVAEYVVVLLSVHGDIVDELQEAANGLRARPGGVAELGEAGLEGLENLVEDIFVRGLHQAGEGEESVTHVRNVKV